MFSHNVRFILVTEELPEDGQVVIALRRASDDRIRTEILTCMYETSRPLAYRWRTLDGRALCDTGAPVYAWSKGMGVIDSWTPATKTNDD